MNIRPLFAAAFALVLTSTAATAQFPGDPNEGSRLTLDPATGLYTFSWFGKYGRTYFLQQSEDLVNWTYVPIIEPGYDYTTGWAFTSSGPRFFLRLKYSEAPTNNPFTADFDGDGVSNWDELMQGTDPFSAALDTNGLPLDWETFYHVPPGTDPNAPAPRADGLTYLQAFQQKLNPNDFYNGQAPTLTLVSGTPQTGAPGGFVTLPLTVLVRDAYNHPIINAPVVYTVGQAGGQVQATKLSTPGTSIAVLSDYDGQAKVYFRLPAATNSTSEIVATAAGTGNYLASVTFAATSDNGNGTYGSPFVPTNVIGYRHPDGSEDLTWQNNTETPTPIIISEEQSDGTWIPLFTLPPGTTSYHIPAP